MLEVEGKVLSHLEINFTESMGLFHLSFENRSKTWSTQLKWQEKQAASWLTSCSNVRRTDSYTNMDVVFRLNISMNLLKYNIHMYTYEHMHANMHIPMAGSPNHMYHCICYLRGDNRQKIFNQSPYSFVSWKSWCLE